MAAVQRLSTRLIDTFIRKPMTVRKMGSYCRWKSTRRNVSGRANIGSYSRAYEGDGRMIASVLNDRNSPVLQIESVQYEGFVLANGEEVVGSLILFPNALLSWHLISCEDLTEEAFSLFKLLDPKLDILIFGYGAQEEFSIEHGKKFIQICKNLKLRYEMLPTEYAVGVYNFLADERRHVAGAFIPPKFIDKLRLQPEKPFLLDDIEDEDEDDNKYLESAGSNEVKQLK